ncbi:MAG: GNAT family N-acetyltransferase [Anaerolineales bacterium]
MQGEVLCRPALPSDREAVMEFLPLIREGEDYVSGVWDEWLLDQGGVLAAAVMGGRAVGLSHLVDLGGGEWWLEGLRVDPRLQGRHIGSHLHEYQVKEWLSTQGDVVRLVTRGQRRAVHRMCARTGFDKTASLSELAFEPTDGGHGFQPAGAEEADRAVPRFLSSPAHAASGGLMDLGWRFARIESERITSAARERRLWQWRDGDGLLVARFGQGPEAGALTLSTVALPEGDPPAFLDDVRRLAGSLGARSGRWLADPLREAQVLAHPGYRLESSDPLWIFERRR